MCFFFIYICYIAKSSDSDSTFFAPIHCVLHSNYICILHIYVNTSADQLRSCRLACAVSFCCKISQLINEKILNIAQEPYPHWWYDEILIVYYISPQFALVLTSKSLLMFPFCCFKQQKLSLSYCKQLVCDKIREAIWNVFTCVCTI